VDPGGRSGVTSPTTSWYLVADIGGSNARFAVAQPGASVPLDLRRYRVDDHADLGAVLETYLAHVGAGEGRDTVPQAACLAVASPVAHDVIRFTNSTWTLDRRRIADRLGLDALPVINDLEAAAYAVTTLAASEWEQLGEGTARPGAPLAVLGPGTGLGVATVIPFPARATVVPGEGGHVDFPAVDALEIEILAYLSRRFGRVSAERLLSGPGLGNIYAALCDIRGVPWRDLRPDEISALAAQGVDAVAAETLDVFCRVLGAMAGNLALTLGARGGVYIAGGIAPRLLPFLRRGEFRERFLAKGRFRDYLSDIPTRVVTAPEPGLRGALRYLQEREGIVRE
jgi:glucokinase